MKVPPIETLETRLKRRKLLTKLIQELEQLTPHVSNTQMRSALSRSEWQVYQTQQRRDLPNYSLSERGCELLTEYSKKLRKADLLYETAERYSPHRRLGRRKKWRAFSLHFNAESAYESAFEFLSDCPSIWRFLDRHVDFSSGGYPDLDIYSAPRLKGSKSGYCLYGYSKVQQDLQAFRLRTAISLP